MNHVFAITPAGVKPLWLLAPVGILLLGIALLPAESAYGANAARFEVLPAGLRLRGDIYGRLIPAAAIRGGAARLVNLRAERAYAPRWRTLGIAVPGYRAGWFRLVNGEKALLYVTDGTRVVYVPTRAGYAVLVSPREPERFLAELRALAPGS